MGKPWSLFRWLLASASLSFPQAASPIAFSLLALSITGNSKGGAAMILAMTIAQILGVIPFTRMGVSFNSVSYLRMLILIRSLALLCIALASWYKLNFSILIILSCFAGLVNGATQGYLRVILNHLVDANRLPRALGLAATLNELIFVLAPVTASGLGSLSPVFSLFVITALGMLPIVLIPSLNIQSLPEVVKTRQRAFTKPVALWLICSTAAGAVVALIEIGAVALAMNFRYEPVYAILFTVPLCLASVMGGIWVSIRNRISAPSTVVLQLCLMTLGALIVTVNISLITAVIGVMCIGSVIAPLGTHFSLVLDEMSPLHLKAEVFALLRTSNALGVIIASALLTVSSLSLSLLFITVFIGVVAAGMAVAVMRKKKGKTSLK
ncbi:MFS transporter [Erwinia persicina]|nr:MFS transporter [Erwinia persicina]MBU9810275.1 MFS transporter [Rahnella perminowiae]MBU9860176.1 MFS transporter [Rahnella aceris]MBU9814955.1 MFS transporter [Rahnella perminowiae]MBU9827911.1 MFS transporter [Rahnella perminowiae]